jgi:hypothetical protein
MANGAFQPPATPLPTSEVPATGQGPYMPWLLVWDKAGVEAPRLARRERDKSTEECRRLLQHPNESDPSCIAIAKVHTPIADSWHELDQHYHLWSVYYLHMLKYPARYPNLRHFLGQMALNLAFERAREHAIAGRVLSPETVWNVYQSWSVWYESKCSIMKSIPVFLSSTRSKQRVRTS